jgi:hypothetical protein
MFYISGLRAKLEMKMPRVAGRIVRTQQDRMILINRGKQHNIYENMDLVIYRMLGTEENPDFEQLCEARVENVYTDRSDVRLDDDCSSIAVDTPPKYIRLISK